MVRNVSVVAVAQAVTMLVTFLFTIAQARFLSPVQFGEFSLALSYSIVLAVVVDFGLSTKLARDVAQRPITAGHALIAALVVRLGLWCVVMPALWVVTVVFGYHREMQASILILGASLLFSGVAASLTAYFQGREEFLYPSLGSIAHRGAAAVLGVGALMLGQGVIALALAYVAASILQVLVMVPAMRRHHISMATFDPSTLVAMFRGAAVLGGVWIFGAIYYNVDMLILERLLPSENLGWYAAAYRLFNAALILPVLLPGVVIYPVLSRLSIGAREELRKAMRRSFTLLFANGVFVALVLAIAAEQIVALLYPARHYAEAATALRLLAPALAAMYANGIFFLALLGMGFERRVLVMAIVLAVANPLLNLAVIPHLQQNGAALATLATEIVVLVWVLALTPKDLRSVASPAIVAKVLTAAVPAALCLWVLRDTLVIGLPLAGLAYVAAVFALGTVDAADLRVLKGLTSRRVREAELPEAAPIVSTGTAEL